MEFFEKNDLENERMLKLIFPSGLSESLRGNPEIDTYLAKLGTYKVEQLKKEQTRIADETKRILEQTQELAISNYKTFITTAENSRSIFHEFQKAEEQVETLIGKLPDFSAKCDQFLEESAELTEQRRLNSITLHKNAQLLEILELPQLMERCIREGRYEEALELASYVQRLGQHQGHLITVVDNIVRSVETLWHTMLVQLVAQLRMDLQLPKCLQIIGFLRRMQAFGDNELKLKFLQARDAWLTSCLEDIPKTDAHQHLMKTIEITRINLFNIITQYRAIFSEEENVSKTVTLKQVQGISCKGHRLFEAWLHNKINAFLLTLEADLQRGVCSVETVLGQCMYFGLSFSRVGADFRALIVPVFVRVVHKKFNSNIIQVNGNFEKELEKFTLIKKVSFHSRKQIVTAALPMSNRDLDSYAPPETLLDFYPLAVLCNGYLNALNELRLCAPLAVATDVTSCLQSSLQFVAQRVLAFFRQEQQAFTGSERETFVKLCACIAYDLVPYVQRCIHGVFPPQSITAQLGISLLQLEQQQLTFLKQLQILEPLKHLLPTEVMPTAPVSRTVLSSVSTKRES